MFALGFFKPHQKTGNFTVTMKKPLIYDSKIGSGKVIKT